MVRWMLLAVAVALSPGCTGDVDTGPGGGADGGGGGADADNTEYGAGEPDDLQGITAAHNAVRAEFSQFGVGPLTWDDDLEAYARTWAEQCVDNGGIAGLIDHNPSTPYGENIQGGGSPPTPEAVVQQWASEESDYDYDSNSCSGVCGHFTQIIWADTTKVGCARYSCPGLTYGEGVLCSYDPPGNYIGQRPY